MFPVATSVDVDEIPAATVALIFLNVAIVLWMATLGAAEVETVAAAYGLVPATFAWNDPARLLTLLTSAFLHAGPLHLLANMWALWLFGRVLESRWGPARFVAFYLACGIAAGLTHIAFHAESAVPAVGASGAIAGVLAGFARIHPTSGVRLATPVLAFPIIVWAPALPFVILWLALQLFSAVFDAGAAAGTPTIAWWAHIGGFLAGLLLSFAFARRADSRIIGTLRPAVLEIGPQRRRTISIRKQHRAVFAPQRAASQPPKRAPAKDAASNPWQGAERIVPRADAVDSGVAAADVAAARLRWNKEGGNRYLGPWGATTSRG